MSYLGSEVWKQKWKPKGKPSGTWLMDPSQSETELVLADTASSD